MTPMAAWQSEQHLLDHFMEHGRQLGCRTVDEYHASAEETLSVGAYFTFFNDDIGEERTGCYDPASHRLVILNGQDEIVTHFLCDAWYVATLPHSTYDER